MDLVEDDGVQALEQIRAGQQHVAEHLGGHHHHGRPRAQRGVAGEQPDVIAAVGGRQLRVLLDSGAGWEVWCSRPATGAERQMDTEGGHERLARSGGCRDEHGVAGLEGFQGLDLEVVEGEG